LIDSESTFYGRYRWCLDAFPTVADLRTRLRGELKDLQEVSDDWRRDEVLCNVFLLSCALADSVDDHLAGDRYDFSQAAALLPARGPRRFPLPGSEPLRRPRTDRPLRRRVPRPAAPFVDRGPAHCGVVLRAPGARRPGRARI